MTQARKSGAFNLQPYVIDYTIPTMQAWKKLPEGLRAEVIDNKLYVSPNPTLYHQQLCETIGNDLKAYVKACGCGTVWFLPIDTFLEGPNKGSVAPDIIFIAKENKLREERRGLFGVPDLLIEVLSSNRKYDQTTKKALYERTGVKEYWLVDPETKNSQGYLLENKKYGDPLLLNSELYIRILKKSIKF